MDVMQRIGINILFFSIAIIQSISSSPLKILRVLFEHDDNNHIQTHKGKNKNKWNGWESLVLAIDNANAAAYTNFHIPVPIFSFYICKNVLQQFTSRYMCVVEFTRFLYHIFPKKESNWVWSGWGELSVQLKFCINYEHPYYYMSHWSHLFFTEIQRKFMSHGRGSSDCGLLK